MASKRGRGITKRREVVERVILEKYPARGDSRSNRDVSRIVGISQQSVSAILAEAERSGPLRMQVDLPCEKRDVADLESATREEFGLQQVLLVPGFPDILEPLSRDERRTVHTKVLRKMAERVVQHLDALLAKARRSRGQFTLGVAWGRSLALVVEKLRMTTRDLHFPEFRSVPIVPIVGEFLEEPTEANVIAMRMAEAYGGTSSQIAFPAFVPREDMWVIDRLAQVRRILRSLINVDAVITSMGPIPDDDAAAQEITIASDRELNATLVKAARIGKAIGEICYWLFDEQGREVKTPYASIGLGFSGLQHIAADPKRQVILLAGGDSRRFEALRAALRARLASVLVSDTVTARYLLGEKPIRRRAAPA